VCLILLIKELYIICRMCIRPARKLRWPTARGDCITRLLLPYRARPSPLNFVTSIATLGYADSMATYFQSHMLPLLPDLEDNSESVAMPTKKDKMTLLQAKTYFLAQRRDGPVHPCWCCRRTWFKRCV
jgi:hypothetical protein